MIKHPSSDWESTGITEAQQQQDINAAELSNLLIDKRESELCSQYAIGNSVLEIGIGTGQRALPLLAKGFEITGIDRSESALNRARQNLSLYSPTLICGDVQKLPFSSESFDTVISLNVLHTFSQWEDTLKEWHRVVKPGGRVIVDFLSSEYLDKFGSESADHPSEKFTLKVGLEHLAHFATTNHLKILTIVPYESLSDTDSLWMKYPGINKSEWDRLLSQALRNQKFFDFLHFLQTDLITFLPTSFIRHYMITFEKAGDSNHNQSQIEHQKNITQQLTSHFSSNEIKTLLGSDTDTFLQRLESYLDDPYCLIFIYKLWLLTDCETSWLDLESLLTQKHWTALNHWAQQRAKDTICLDFVENWHRLPLFKESLSFHNVPLGAGLEYDLISDALTLFNAFNKDAE